MTLNTKVSLARAHRDALLWFDSHAGQEIVWPAPLNGLHLVSKAKGIHKPAGLEYALSVRQSMSGPYDDTVTQLPDGAWHIQYAQEGANPSYFTNRALMACKRDSVPIGVLVQVQVKPSPRYKVLGLGQVIDCQQGVFSIKEFRSRVVTDNDPTSLAVFFNAADEQDARKRTLQSIAVRRGQPAFRNKLIRAYGGACAISGCTVVETLEAAHILPFRGEHTNHVQNGLLLRADLHTLFDLGMLNIDPDHLVVRFSDIIRDEIYTVYEGKRVNLPLDQNEWPSPDALRVRIARRIGAI